RRAADPAPLRTSPRQRARQERSTEMKNDRDLANILYRNNFGAFTYRAFAAINPGQRLIANWHIDVICYHLQLMVKGETRKRLATSVGGTLTGRGGEVLIIDDPIKANDADSEVARRGAIEWFNGTARSRLDNPATSLVCIAMQRLHVDDLAGFLIEQGWPKLV